MQKKKWGIIAAGVWLLGMSAFGTRTISAYTEHKISEILTPYVILGLEEEKELPLQAIDAWEAEVAETLPQVAVDLEQEQLIFESLFLMERRHYLFNPATKSPELYAKLKAQFKKNERWIAAHESESISKWLYLFTGDLTSCYMVRSLAATIGYGLNVKHLYEKALAADATFAYPSINLGVWKYYAPHFFGGGEKKAAKQFELALQQAAQQAHAEKQTYIAALYLSQYWFTQGAQEQCAAYLLQAETLFPQSKEIPFIKKINERGISLYQFNRNQSGFDENTDTEERDDE